jgi:hypothetical protein
MNLYNFTIDSKQYSIVNDVKETRNGFKHISTLFVKYNAINESYSLKTIEYKYINRTWESFQYESIMKALINQYFQSSDDIKAIYNQLGIESL